MMDVLRTAEIKGLLRANSDPCISIYCPTHEKGTEAKEDSIRFKNLLRKCEKHLQARGISRDQLARLLQPAQVMPETSTAWQHLERGLVAFISPGAFRTFTLPLECREQAWVGTRFYLKPLAALCDGERRLCILAHYRDLFGHGHASDRLEEIVPAARLGRVHTLLLDPTACAWANGGATDASGPVEPEQNRLDLLDVAVRWTLSRGGAVYAVARGDLPAQSPVGAILRY